MRRVAPNDKERENIPKVYIPRNAFIFCCDLVLVLSILPMTSMVTSLNGIVIYVGLFRCQWNDLEIYGQILYTSTSQTDDATKHSTTNRRAYYFTGHTVYCILSVTVIAATTAEPHWSGAANRGLIHQDNLCNKSQITAHTRQAGQHTHTIFNNNVSMNRVHIEYPIKHAIGFVVLVFVFVLSLISLKRKCHFWWNFHHRLHWKLSKWQLPEQPVMKINQNDDISISVL